MNPKSNKEELITDKIKITGKYLTSWFIIDFISIFPFDLIYDNPHFRWFKYLRILRVFRLINFFEKFLLEHKILQIKAGNLYF